MQGSHDHPKSKGASNYHEHHYDILLRLRFCSTKALIKFCKDLWNEYLCSLRYLQAEGVGLSCQLCLGRKVTELLAVQCDLSKNEHSVTCCLRRRRRRCHYFVMVNTIFFVAGCEWFSSCPYYFDANLAYQYSHKKVQLVIRCGTTTRQQRLHIHRYSFSQLETISPYAVWDTSGFVRLKRFWAKIDISIF